MAEKVKNETDDLVKLQIACHKAIQQAKTARVKKEVVFIHQIKDIRVKYPTDYLSKSGEFEIEASAELYFVAKDDDNYLSTGKRTNFRVNMLRTEDDFQIVTPIVITDDIVTSYLKTSLD